MPARIGTEFAGYRIEALVGRGGTSTVYRAEDPRLRIPIALKLLNPDAAEDESFRERFVREFRLVAGINHPNILPVYDAGVWQDSLYIAMRYVAGGTLKARVQEGPLAPDRALSMLAQVGGGLDAAHVRGLVHRDVKPANIMVDSGNGPEGPEIAYVTDFGRDSSYEPAVRLPRTDRAIPSRREAAVALPVGATPAMRMRHLVRTESTEARLVANEKSKPLLTGTKSPRSSVDRAAVS